MSIQAVSWVLDHSESKGVARLVLISLANHANQDGECWPSQRTIAKEAGISVGSVSNQVKRLVEIGELAVLEEGGPRRSARYQMTFAQQLHLRSPDERSGDERSAQPRSERSAQPRVGQNRHRTITEVEETTTTTALPAERWTRRWCEIRGVTPTRSVLRNWIPKVQEFIKAGGDPSEELLEHAHSAGIETPGGWSWVAPDVVDRQEVARAEEWMNA